MERKKDAYKGLEERINAYFDYCDEVNGDGKKILKPYTLSGLLAYAGLTRQEFEKLALMKRHGRLLHGAKSKIEAFIEENALTGCLSANASANSLKYNFGWGEKQEKDEADASKHICVTLSPEIQMLGR